MMPLWTTTRSPEQSACGCAFASDGRPCVAQRVCAIPTLPATGSGPAPTLDARPVTPVIVGCGGPAVAMTPKVSNNAPTATPVTRAVIRYWLLENVVANAPGEGTTRASRDGADDGGIGSMNS